MLEGVFYVIILPICLNPAPLDGNPLLVVDDAPTDLLDVFNALFPGGATGGILSVGLNFLLPSGIFSLNSLSNVAACTRV